MYAFGSLILGDIGVIDKNLLAKSILKTKPAKWVFMVGVADMVNY